MKYPNFLKQVQTLQQLVEANLKDECYDKFFPQLDQHMATFYEIEDSLRASPYMHRCLMKYLRPLYEAWMMGKIDQGGNDNNMAAWIMCRRIKDGEINDQLNTAKLSGLPKNIATVLRQLEDETWTSLFGS